MNRVVPLEARHVAALLNSIPLFGLEMSAEEYAKKLMLDGLSFAGESDDGAIIGAAGIMPMWKGVGEAWTILSLEARQHPFFLHREVSRNLDRIAEQHQFHRIQANVKYGFKQGYRWCERMGFLCEGNLFNFGPDKSTFVRYAKLYAR